MIQSAGKYDQIILILIVWRCIKNNWVFGAQENILFKKLWTVYLFMDDSV